MVIFELTDPGAAGEDMEILDQDIVHLGSEPFSARRVLVNLDKSMFVYHSTSHRVRTRTRIHQALMALLIIGPKSRASFDGRDMDSDVLVAGEAAGKIDLGPYADWLCPERIYMNVERAYREFRGEPFDQPWDQAKTFAEVYGVAVARGIPPNF